MNIYLINNMSIKHLTSNFNYAIRYTNPELQEEAVAWIKIRES